MAKIRRIEEITRREMEGFSHPLIREIRIMGACVCVEVHSPEAVSYTHLVGDMHEGTLNISRRKQLKN